jgi:hypothetical protein
MSLLDRETEMFAMPHQRSDSGNGVRDTACLRLSEPPRLQALREQAALVTPFGGHGHLEIVTTPASQRRLCAPVGCQQERTEP